MNVESSLSVDHVWETEDLLSTEMWKKKESLTDYDLKGEAVNL